MKNNNDFRKFAMSNGVNGFTFDNYQKAQNGLFMPKDKQVMMPQAGYINPSIIEEHQLNVAIMDVFSRLMMDRIIFLGSDIDADVSSILTAQLLYLDSNDEGKDISIYINSPGGSVYDGLAIYDTMQFIDSEVSTLCTGMAASMASVLLAAGENGKRFALPHSRIMIHQPMGGAGGGTQESDMQIIANELKLCKDTLYTILSEHTGKSIEEITADADRDHWISPKDAVPGKYGELGLIDEVCVKKSQVDND